MPKRDTIIFIFLLIIGAGLVAYSISKISPPLSMVESAHATQLSELTERHLTDQSISFFFKAKYNNLGQVGIRFHNNYRINPGYVNFKIRNRSSEKWLYENQYKVDQFQPDQIFPFGFPLISDSEDEDYEVEIAGSINETDKTISFSIYEPVIVSRYEFRSSYLLDNPQFIPTYIQEKLVYYLGPIAVIKLLSLSFLPATIFLTLTRSKKNTTFIILVLAANIIDTVTQNHSFRLNLMVYSSYLTIILVAGLLLNGRSQKTLTYLGISWLTIVVLYLTYHVQSISSKVPVVEGIINDAIVKATNYLYLIFLTVLITNFILPKKTQK